MSFVPRTPPAQKPRSSAEMGIIIRDADRIKEFQTVEAQAGVLLKKTKVANPIRGKAR
jgi:hypothetical protein